MNKIQMVDLYSQYMNVKEEVDKEIFKVINSSSFIKGQVVNEFESELAAYLNTRNVISCGNGTDALQLSLMALDLNPGDEIITTSFTFIATVEVISLLNLTPILVDVDPHNYNISIAEIKKAITPKTKAIIPVHLFGQSAFMEEIVSIAEENDLIIVEDACQSLGSDYIFSNGNRKKSGTIGHLGCTSFFPSKNLGAFGDGGAIFTDDNDLAKRIRSLANHGMEIRYHHDYIGINSRLDSIQAAILKVKLKHLDSYIINRQQAASIYDNKLSTNKNIILPHTEEYSTHVYHQYTLKTVNLDRDGLRQYLAENNIPAMIYYPKPIHLQKAFSKFNYDEANFPTSELLSKSVLSLPMHTELNDKQLDHICNTVNEYSDKNN